MADNGDVNVKIKLGADVSGGVQSRAEMQKLRAEAKRTATESAASSGKMSQGLQGVSRTVGLVRKALIGFGVIGIFTSLISAVEKVSASFGDSKRKAEEFRKAAEARDLAKSINDLADSYAKVKESIASAAEEEKNALEIIDMEVKARRELKEAKIDAAEQDELAKVDENDAYAEEKKKIIQAKYNHMRATNAASNKTEDLVLQRQKYKSAAETNDAEAKAASDQAAALDIKAKEVRRFAGREAEESTQLNDKDRNGFWSHWAGTVKDVVTLEWGHAGKQETEEGDAEREKHSAKADEYIKQAEALEKQAEALRKEAKSKKDEAEQNRKRYTALNASIEASQIAAGTTQVKEGIAEADAQRELTKKREDKAKEKAKVDDAKRAVELLQAEKDRIQAEIADRQSDKDAMGKYVADAEGDYETAKLGKNSKAQKSAYANLRKLQETAQNVNHEADSAINALTETLRSVETRLKAAQSAIKQSSKQQQYAWAESPSGE